jgi:hypothetical protein
MEIMGFLVSEKWHKPYAEALLETDPLKVLTLISEAEHEILTRLLELQLSPGSKEQNLDLRRAVDTLVTLRRRNLPAYVLQRFTA